jgi:hypothetical protein
MDDAEFWQLIESSQDEAHGARDPKQAIALLRRKLEQLRPEEIVSFNQIFNRKYLDAFSWDLWAAAFIINGGCGDDGFMDFREALVARGQPVYQAALRDPETLADVEPPVRPVEGWGSAAQQAYEAVTGAIELPGDAYAPNPEGPAGTEWEEEELAEKYPRLARKFDFEG